MGQSLKCMTGYLDPRIVAFVESKIRFTKILVVSKTSCKACSEAKQLLRTLSSRTGINPTVFEIDKYENECRSSIIKYLSEQTGISTVPQIFINGRFVGGNDTIQRLHQERRLVSLILQPVKPTRLSSKHKPSLGDTALRRGKLSNLRYKLITEDKNIPILSESKSDGFNNFDHLPGGYHPAERRTSQPDMADCSPFFEIKRTELRRRRSAQPTTLFFKSGLSVSNVNHPNVPMEDLEILNKPARRLSKHSFKMGDEHKRSQYASAEADRIGSVRETPFLRGSSDRRRHFTSALKNDSQQISSSHLQVSQLL